MCSTRVRPTAARGRSTGCCSPPTGRVPWDRTPRALDDDGRPATHGALDDALDDALVELADRRAAHRASCVRIEPAGANAQAGGGQPRSKRASRSSRLMADSCGCAQWRCSSRRRRLGGGMAGSSRGRRGAGSSARVAKWARRLAPRTVAQLSRHAASDRQQTCGSRMDRGRERDAGVDVGVMLMNLFERRLISYSLRSFAKVVAAVTCDARVDQEKNQRCQTSHRGGRVR